MRTDKETRELQAIWKFMLDLAEAVTRAHEGPQAHPLERLAELEASEDLKTHIKDTAAAYGTNIGS